MKTMVLVTADILYEVRQRFTSYLQLTRPRIAVSVLFTVATGFWLGTTSHIEWGRFFYAVIGTGLVAAGASAFNQVLEQRTDALMKRTKDRPIPAGRLHTTEALVFGVVISLAGFAELAVMICDPVVLAIAGVNFLSYLLLYTPLKRVTTLNTIVGAIPGALPPLIGAAAAGNPLDRSAVVLAVLLFLWQVPHFLAIAWIYRKDYARAGLKMLPVVDASGIVTAQQMVGYCWAMLPVSLIPVVLGSAGGTYLLGVCLLGNTYLYSTIRFWQDRDDVQARHVFRTSLVYLSALLAVTVIDRSIGSTVLPPDNCVNRFETSM